MNTRKRGARRTGLGNMYSTIPGISLITPMTQQEMRTGLRGLGDAIIPTSATTATATGDLSTANVAAETSSFFSDLVAFATAHPIGSSVFVFALHKVLK